MVWLKVWKIKYFRANLFRGKVTTDMLRRDEVGMEVVRTKTQ